MSFFLVDYRCEGCGDVFESYETRGQISDSSVHPKCGASGSRQLAAPLVGSPRVHAAYSTASTEKPPGAVCTRDIAEGMSTTEWRKKRRAERRKDEYVASHKEAGTTKIISTAKAATS